MAGKLRPGEWIVGLGALGLLIATFLPWYHLGGVHLTAWDELDIGRYLLLATAIVGLVLVLAAATARTAESSFLMAARTAVVCFACATYVIYRLLERPDALNADVGAFVGFASIVLMMVGSIVSMREHLATRTSTGGPPSR